MNIVTTTEQLHEVVDAYLERDAFVFDVETMGENRGEPILNQVTWIGMSTYGRTDVIPMGHPNGEFSHEEYPLLKSGLIRQAQGKELRPQDYSTAKAKAVPKFGPPPEQLTRADVFSALKPLFLDDEITKVCHNVPFDIPSVTKYFGEMPPGPYFCTMNASIILDVRDREHAGLDDCVKRYLDIDMVKGVGKRIEDHDFDTVARYTGLDSKYTWLLYRTLKKFLAEDKLMPVWSLEMDLMEVVCEMRLAGVHMDMAALEILKKQLTGDVEAAKGRAFKAAGREFNFNSNPEKVKLLFGPKEEGGQGLRPKVFTATGNPSASEDALKHFPRNELVKHMIEAADVNKLMNTFVIPYAGGDVVRTTNGKSKIETRDSVIINGKIHTEFVQNGTETGRFSSRNPNLQQVPNPRTERGKAIRNLFVAGPGNVLVVADYGQIEPRVTAAFSGDPTMMNSFINNEDIYTAIASPFGLDRAAGKVLVLSMLYGVGADKTAESLGVSVRKAEQIMSDFDKHFPAVDKFRKQVIRDARSRAPVPYVRTMLGRRRYLPDLRSSKFGLKMRAQRQAFNAVIQGSSADIIKFAMVRAHRMIPDEAQLILTIHDELVTQTPVELADETYAAIREAMEGFNPLKTVPLVADIKVVDTWGAAK